MFRSQHRCETGPRLLKSLVLRCFKCREVGRIGLAGQMARRQMSPQHGSEAEAEAKARWQEKTRSTWSVFLLLLSTFSITFDPFLIYLAKNMSRKEAEKRRFEP